MNQESPKCIIVPPRARKDLAERKPNAHQFAIAGDDDAIRSIEVRGSALIVEPIVRGDEFAEHSTDQRIERFAKNLELPVILE